MSNVSVGKKCSVLNCNATAVTKDGLCGKHYMRLKRHGTTDDSVGKQIVQGYAKMNQHPLYPVWRNMDRTHNGALLCDRWRQFPNFVEDVKCKPDGDFYLRRIEQDKPFSIDNCRWQPIERNTVGANSRKEYMREWSKKSREVNPDYYRSSKLKKYYGITLDQYNEMLESQGGVCKICGKPESRRTKTGEVMNLHVDHCHTTNVVRGLLCHHCNIALGSFGDNVDTLLAAIYYLEAANKIPLTPAKT